MKIYDVIGKKKFIILFGGQLGVELFLLRYAILGKLPLDRGTQRSQFRARMMANMKVAK